MHITVLGITGGVGHAVSNAFVDHGHTVTALVRDVSRVTPREGLTLVEGDARDAQALDRALDGADAVFHGLNLPYPDWDPGMIDLTTAVVAAAERTGAALLFPGNLYGLGPDFGEPLTEASPREPVSRKGELRNRIEAMLEAATVQTVVLRAGDFFGGIGESSWMHHLTQGVSSGGALRYAGPMDMLHSWAFLPDVAETFVLLAERLTDLGQHEVFHFEGHVVDGNTWVDAVRAAIGDPSRSVRSMPWFWMQLGRPFVPMVRELLEMRYLWDRPVRMDGSRLRSFLDEVPHTPFREAVEAQFRVASAAAA